MHWPQGGSPGQAWSSPAMTRESSECVIALEASGSGPDVRVEMRVVQAPPPPELPSGRRDRPSSRGITAAGDAFAEGRHLGRRQHFVTCLKTSGYVRLLRISPKDEFIQDRVPCGSMRKPHSRPAPG